MADRDRVIAILEEHTALLRSILAALSPGAGASRSAAGAVASDRELDSQYGNPEVRGKDPREWKGPPMRGRKYSECPAEYLDLLAESLEWQAQQAEKKNELTNGGKPVAEFRRKDAARARGWAKRMRAGQAQQQPPRQEPVERQPAFATGNEFEEVGDFTPNNWR